MTRQHLVSLLTTGIAKPEEQRMAANLIMEQSRLLYSVFEKMDSLIEFVQGMDIEHRF